MNKAWKKLHDHYKKQDWINKPNIFAEFVVQYFPEKGELLDLGAGQGQDSSYFAKLGYNVTSTDISKDALEISKTKAEESGLTNIDFGVLDLQKKFPFKDKAFDVVYAHLSIHYFPINKTKEIIKEIKRVLKPNGVFAMFNNSTSDPEYGSGKELEKDYFLLKIKIKDF